MMEATLLLAAIAQRFQFRSVPDHPIATVPSFTLRPKYGIKMISDARRTSTVGLQQAHAIPV
jgi:hypothetical protein